MLSQNSPAPIGASASLSKVSLACWFTTDKSSARTWPKSTSAWMSCNGPCGSMGFPVITTLRSPCSKSMVRSVFKIRRDPADGPDASRAQKIHSETRISFSFVILRALSGLNIVFSLGQHQRNSLIVGLDRHGQRFSFLESILGHRKTYYDRALSLRARLNF